MLYLELVDITLYIPHMWLTPGKASGRKNSAPILFINTPGE